MNEVVIAVIMYVPVGLLLSVVVLVIVRMRHGNVRCQKPTVSSPPADNVDIDITCLPLNDAYGFLRSRHLLISPSTVRF